MHASPCQFHSLVLSFFVRPYLSLQTFISNVARFFSKLRYNITCSPKGKDPNFHPLTCLNSRFNDFLNLPAEVVFRPLLRYFTIYGILGLRFKQGWSRQKSKTRGYKFHEGRRTQFCPKDTQKFSSTNQTYYPIGSVMTQSRLVTHNWSSIAPNWERPVFLVSQYPKLQLLWRNIILIPLSSYSNSLYKSRDESVQIHQPFHLHTTSTIQPFLFISTLSHMIYHMRVSKISF
jgi:hypothetical protein